CFFTKFDILYPVSTSGSLISLIWWNNFLYGIFQSWNKIFHHATFLPRQGRILLRSSLQQRQQPGLLSSCKALQRPALLLRCCLQVQGRVSCLIQGRHSAPGSPWQCMVLKRRGRHPPLPGECRKSFCPPARQDRQ